MVLKGEFRLEVMQGPVIGQACPREVNQDIRSAYSFKGIRKWRMDIQRHVVVITINCRLGRW
jgi:hypothetical protein